jgi:hypothetical protein
MDGIIENFVLRAFVHVYPPQPLPKIREGLRFKLLNELEF